MVPFSNIAEESECWPSEREVFLTLSRANFAASNSTSFVVSFISVFSPPMMPASAAGLLPSHITRLSWVSVNVFSSSVVIFSPSSARLTTISLPSMVSRSNACMGWPISKSTKLVMSTTLFMDRSPHSASLRLIHMGEGAIFMSFT